MRVLVVAAHPDDEILGCGATMARHAAQGDEVFVEIMAEGLTSRDGSAGAAELAQLRAAANAAGKLVGAKAVRLHGLPDNRLDTVPLLDVVKRIEAAIAEHAPQIVYTHHGGDLNVDHEIVSRAVMTACRPQPGAGVRTILAFEVPSSTEWRGPVADSFVPNWSVDVSDTLATKLKALEAYAGEMREWPHARSAAGVEALARWRGASVGVAAAEAFCLMRNIVKSRA